MKAAVARKPVIRIAVVESDPLRFVGFRALFDAEPEFELISAALPEIRRGRIRPTILPSRRSQRGSSAGDRFYAPISIARVTSPEDAVKANSTRVPTISASAACATPA